MASGDVEEGRVPNEEDLPSICMIPRVLRNLSVESFTPMVVSIGPLHNDDENLKELEGLKDYYLRHLLSFDVRNNCLEAVKTSMEKIRSCYDEGVNEKYNDAQLAKMMVQDGYFILLFCLEQYCHKENKSIFLNDLQNVYIARDLILLENQIPFFVLETISQQIGNNISLTDLLRMVIGLYNHPFDNSFDHTDLLEKFSVNDVSKDHSAAHILDCLHKCYHLPDVETEKVTETCCLRVNCREKKEKEAAHSVVELERSGVNFKSHHQEEKQGMTMKFERSPFPCFYGWSWSKPSLLMPKLVIEDFTEVVLRNFIAYEQSFPKVKYYFTSYAYVMDKLIDSPADVGKLVESKVLVNNLGSNKDAADMINNITKKIYVEEDVVYYRQVIQELDEYYNGTWPNYIATLRRTYFNNPWSFIALLAGIALFVLTVIQTIFSVMCYNP